MGILISRRSLLDAEGEAKIHIFSRRAASSEGSMSRPVQALM